MTDAELQLYLQLALALGGGVLLGFVIGVVLRLRRVGELQQALRDRSEQLEAGNQSLAAVSGERDELRSREQAAMLKSGVLESELRAARERVQEYTAELGELRLRIEAAADNYQRLQNNHTELQAQQAERDHHHAQQLQLLNENKEALKREFENLANKIFEDKGKSFTSTSRESLEAMLKPFREQISGFQTRINEVHSESLKGNTALESEIKKVLEIGLQMNDQASNLTLALKGDKKTTGNWGEAQLERTLEMAGLQSGEHYESQASFRDPSGKRKLPDFLIKLPDGKHLVIDSKVSLVDYDRAIAADTDEERTEAMAAHARAVRNHIDDLSSKDYANLPGIGSPDFVLMFMPIEPAYIEAMKHNRELFNQGYQKGVIMVSHTTLMPILRTVANLWMADRSNKEAREISNRAGEIYNQVCLVAERLHKLGNTLKAAGNHYNEAITGLVGKQGLHGKVERFQQLSASANKEMARLEPIHADIDNDRLSLVIDNPSPADQEASLEDTPRKT